MDVTPNGRNSLNQILKIGKLTGLQQRATVLTNFKYEEHAITRNGNYANLLKLGWKICETTSSVLLWQI